MKKEEEDEREPDFVEVYNTLFRDIREGFSKIYAKQGKTDSALDTMSTHSLPAHRFQRVIKRNSCE